jgi:hypothetical protein
MNLELTERQARVLNDALESFLKGLLTELVHTDDRAFRDELRQSYLELEGLRRRLEGLLSQTQAYA